jgi:hypothetical protein
MPSPSIDSADVTFASNPAGNWEPLSSTADKALLHRLAVLGWPVMRGKASIVLTRAMLQLDKAKLDI